MVNIDFWKGKKVFITGHTGFKGSWLSLWLIQMGCQLRGYSLNPLGKNNLFELAKIGQDMDSHIDDIRNFDQLSKSIRDFNPDIIFHLAAQPLVRDSYEKPLETYMTNVMGTAHVLESARRAEHLGAVVVITTDKCYENKEWIYGYKETDSMGGHDPYSSSKGCCELLTTSYTKSFFNSLKGAKIASARAGNVIGGGDWSKDRLVPDILRAFEQSQPVVIRNPSAVRPWQHVLEPLSGYLVLAQNLYSDRGSQFIGGWNFGPEDSGCRSVEWILDRMVNLWGNDASWRLDETSNPHEANLLKLDISKAKHFLKWDPTWTLRASLSKIIDWHKEWLQGTDMKEYSLNEIADFIKHKNANEN